MQERCINQDSAMYDLLKKLAEAVVRANGESWKFSDRRWSFSPETEDLNQENLGSVFKAVEIPGSGPPRLGRT